MKSINIELSKPAFFQHMIVTLESVSYGELLALTTFEPRRGRSSRFYINAFKFGNRLNESNYGSTFLDSDLHSFMKAYRDSEDVIHLSVSWIRTNGRDDITGYTQHFDLSLLFIKTVMIMGDPGKTLVPINRDIPKAEITLTPSAHCMVRRVAKDKLTCRALSKAMARSFFWKDSHVTLYADMNVPGFLIPTMMHCAPHEAVDRTGLQDL